jgi:hypothetical protein
VLYFPPSDLGTVARVPARVGTPPELSTVVDSGVDCRVGMATDFFGCSRPARGSKQGGDPDAEARKKPAIITLF